MVALKKKEIMDKEEVVRRERKYCGSDEVPGKTEEIKNVEFKVELAQKILDEDSFLSYSPYFEFSDLPYDEKKRNVCGGIDKLKYEIDKEEETEGRYPLDKRGEKHSEDIEYYINLAWNYKENYPSHYTIQGEWFAIK